MKVKNVKFTSDFCFKINHKEQKYLFSNKYLEIIVIVLAHDVLVKQRGKKHNSFKDFMRKKIFKLECVKSFLHLFILREDDSTGGTES